MLELLKNREEKKVEYIELIYDLIFVYILGRSNTILHTVENGFIAPSAMLTYLLSTLTILQIWYMTVLFINKYGENGLQENIAIFINMYLLYYMADGTRAAWQDFYMRYNVAWLLILLNLTLQYFIKYKKIGRLTPWVTAHLKRNIGVLLIQMVVIAVSLPVYRLTGVPLSPLAMAFGLLSGLFSRKTESLVEGDFSHLTERIMLYVVFTFGEMIIAIASYFEGGFTANSIYFSLCAFLIVAGLFLTYGFVYDNVIDRELRTSGNRYMLLHVFLIAALNNITAALEFMRNPEVRDIPKNIFMVASLIAYFLFLFLTERYALVRCRGNLKFFAVIVALSLVFAGLMTIFYKNGYASIAVSVLYIYSIFLYLYLYVRKVRGIVKKSKEEQKS